MRGYALDASVVLVGRAERAFEVNLEERITETKVESHDAVTCPRQIDRANRRQRPGARDSDEVLRIEHQYPTLVTQIGAHSGKCRRSQQAKLLNGFNRSVGYLDKTEARNAAVDKACERRQLPSDPFARIEFRVRADGNVRNERNVRASR